MASPYPSSVCCVYTAFVAFLGLGLVLLNSAELVEGQSILCPDDCACLGELVDCSQQKLTEIPGPIYSHVTMLHLQGNKITTIPEDAFAGLINLKELILANNRLSGEVNVTSFHGLRALRELSLARNRLTKIPFLGPHTGNLTRLVLSNNQISEIPPGVFDDLPNLRMLDLSNNKIREIPIGAFSWPNKLHHLVLSNNRISQILPGSLDNLTVLDSLKLGKNRITTIPLDLFSETHKLTTLDLSRNRLRVIQSLLFTRLQKLEVLILNRNRISQLDDGAFWGLDNLAQLQLDYNEIGSVSKGWLYGLHTLRNLQLSHNKVNSSDPEGWRFCELLETLDLSYNELSLLELESFSWLTHLTELALNHNSIGSIADSAFQGLSSLQTLDLSHNDISWTIEDMTGAFEGLESLTQLNLAHNQIKSIAKKAFTGLETLELLDLRQNFITTIQNNAFSNMEGLTGLLLNSSSMLCDCELEWFPGWVTQAEHRASVQAECAHPEALRGINVFDVESDDFICDDPLQPIIVRHPETAVVLRGDNVSMICTAASSSKSPVQFAWKKDNKLMSDLKMLSFESQGEGNMREFTTVLRLTNIQDEDQGRYQCVISNHFGSTYSKKAKVTVHVFPSFIMTPSDVEVKVGQDATLKCAAQGHPIPEIAWQKDGGENFPAALERRFRVMESESEEFYIVDVKLQDMGIYSCTAANEAGTIIANATLTVLDLPRFVKPLSDVEARIGETTMLECKVAGSPKPKVRWLKDDKDLMPSDDILLVEGGSVLIISSTKREDSGTYTCEVSNTLGVKKESARLIIRGNVQETMTIWIIAIAVVCCVVGTSLIWVLVIYHTRKRPNRVRYRTASAGLPPDDPTLPPEIPSSAFNGSSEGTIHQETSSGVSSAATDKYQGDNASDCDSLDSPTQQVMFTFPSRGVRTAAIFPSETDMEGIQREGICIADIDNDGPDDILNSSDHLYPELDHVDTVGDEHSDMELPPEYPGHESSDNAIVKHPYPREAHSYDALDGMRRAPSGPDGCHHLPPCQCHSHSLGRIHMPPGCAKVSKENHHTSATYPRQSPSSRRCRTPEPHHLSPHLPHHQQNGKPGHHHHSNHSVHSNYSDHSNHSSSPSHQQHHQSNHNHHPVNIYENPTTQTKLPPSSRKSWKGKHSILPTTSPLPSTQITELCQERAPSLQPNRTPRIPPSTV